MDNLDINDDKDSENFFEEDVTDQDLNSVLDKIENETDLSEGQKARMQKNKLKALALKKARLLSNPYEKEKSKKRSQTGTNLPVRTATETLRSPTSSTRLSTVSATSAGTWRGTVLMNLSPKLMQRSSF